MSLTTYEQKKNPKTGKWERTGNVETIGNVSRGADGGYSKGVTTVKDSKGKTISSLTPTGQIGLSGAVYSSTPNKSSSSPAPNTSTNQGPVFTPAPPPPNAIGQNADGSYILGPSPSVPVPQPTTPAAASGQASQQPTSSQPAQSSPQAAQPVQQSGPQPQLTTAFGRDGSAYRIDPNSSFISQTGEYQYDFWTMQGQKERLANALDTVTPRLSSTMIGGKQAGAAGVAATATIDLLNAATILNGAVGLFNTIRGYAAVGSVAFLAGGAESIAVATPEAAGLIKQAAPVVGGILKNPKTDANIIKQVTSVLSKELPEKKTVGGYIVKGLLAGEAYAILQTAPSTNTDISNVGKDILKTSTELRATGIPAMVDMADELDAHLRDLKDGWDVVVPFIPLFGKGMSNSKVKALVDDVNSANNELVILEAQKAEEAKKAAVETKRIADEQERQDEITADELKADATVAADKLVADAKVQAETTKFERDQITTESNRAYEAEVLADQRAYQEQQQQAEIDARLKAEGVATQTSEGSTLSFGLLGGSGSTEFVDKDKAAQVYFGKPYAELTPEQLLLLNLLKGDKGASATISFGG